MTTINIDQNRYKQAIPFFDSRGIKITMYLPPIFIPQSVNGSYISEDDSFEIKFNYKEIEVAITLFDNDHARFMVGKHTKKPLALHIKNVKKQGVTFITLEQIFNDAISKVDKPIEKGNMEVAKSVVTDNVESFASTVPSI